MSPVAVLHRLNAAIGLSLGGWVACAIAALALGVGLIVNIAGLALLGMIIAIFVVAVWLTSLPAPRLDVQRRGLPSRLVLGRQVTAQLLITPRRARSQIELIEHFDSPSWPTLRVALTNLRAGTTQQVTYRFPADRRGSYRVGPTVMRWRDPFALTRRERVVAPPTTVMVHPLAESLTDVIAARAFDDPLVRPPQSRPWPTGAEFYGWRDYQVGDDIRQLNWRALAQHDTYLVREAEHGITSNTRVILDTNAASYGAPPNPPPQLLLPTFECAIRACASVVRSHVRADQSVTIQLGSTTRQLHRGVHNEFALLDQLARLTPDQHPVTKTLWELVRTNPFGHLVFITGNLTVEVVNLISVLAARHLSITVVVATGETTSALTWDLLTSLRATVVVAQTDQSIARAFAKTLAGGR
ncbi:MAG: DUF58 domain-containing protein [Bowdeniella nasicola]|nr:DUF58 domain-containing protein [Bowdeniella nasicola]